jgi:hypothetical protein
MFTIAECWENMTEIAGFGAANAGFLRANFQNEEQQINQQQAQKNTDSAAVAERRIGQDQGSQSDKDVSNPGNQNFDFGADYVQQEQVKTEANDSLEGDENPQVQLQNENIRPNGAVEISLSNAAQQGLSQTNSSQASDEFTRTVDDKRERDNVSTGESRGARELGRVLDTFA